MKADNGVEKIIGELKKKGSAGSPVGQRAAPRSGRRSIRRPYEEGVRMAQQVVEEYAKDLAKIN
jgi:hypothetical protein